MKDTDAMPKLSKPLILSLLLCGNFSYMSFALAGEGHDAGYEWAEENSIEDAADCDTPSSSFNEGCEEYVEENASSSYDEDEDEEY